MLEQQVSSNSSRHCRRDRGLPGAQPGASHSGHSDAGYLKLPGRGCRAFIWRKRPGRGRVDVNCNKRAGWMAGRWAGGRKKAGVAQVWRRPWRYASRCIGCWIHSSPSQGTQRQPGPILQHHPPPAAAPLRVAASHLASARAVSAERDSSAASRLAVSRRGHAREEERLTTPPAALSAFHPTPSLAHRQQPPAVTMAAANGTLTPPTLPPAPTSPSAAKRKLASPRAKPPNGAPTPAQADDPQDSTRSLQAALHDILDVLKRYDCCDPASRLDV